MSTTRHISSTRTTTSAAELRARLSAALPDLGSDRLDSLVADVSTELEHRVGRRLADRLTEAQLAEFESLVREGDDDACTRWMVATLPDSSRRARAELNTIVAETVAVLRRHDQRADADAEPPTTVTLERFDRNLIHRSLTARGLKNIVDAEGNVFLTFRDNDSARPAVHVQLSATGSGGNLLIIQASTDAAYTSSERPHLAAFAETWNRTKWWPKTYVSDDGEDTVHVFAETAYPLARGVHWELFDELVHTAISTSVHMFEDLHTSFRAQPRENT